jgi:hypothetical protein
MNLQHINIKILVDGDRAIDWERLIRVFHGWTAAQSMPEMMIDVADYRHVPNGPGVVLVGHEADYSLDDTGGRPGLRYNCKAEQPGNNEDRFRQAFAAVATASARLEAELPGLTFRRTEFEFAINDRALAPNTEETRAAVDAELPGMLESVFGQGDIRIKYESDPRRLFGADITLSKPFELTAS